MKRLIVMAGLSLLLSACNDNKSADTQSSASSVDPYTATVQAQVAVPASTADQAEPQEVDSVTIASSETAEPVAVQ